MNSKVGPFSENFYSDFYLYTHKYSNSQVIVCINLFSSD